MLHPFFATLIQRPDLIADHVAGYAQLFQEEAGRASDEVVTRVVAWFAAAILGVVFVGLAGVALMLGVMQNSFHWILILVPGCALLAAIVAIVKARKPIVSERFPEFRAQIDKDVRAMRSVA